MKRLVVAVLVVALLGGTSVAFASARGTYKGLQVVGVVVNGQELKPDVPAVVMDDRTLLPVRAVAEALGAEVEWDEATYTAKVTLPRDLNQEEFQAWQQELTRKLAVLWIADNALFDNLNQGHIDRAAFNEGLVNLCPQAQELLQYSASVTSSDPAVRGQIMGASGVAALAYADVMLQVSSIADERQQETAGLAHQAMLHLFQSFGGSSQATPDRAVFSQYFARLSIGRLPAQYVGRQDWPQRVVFENVFLPGDVMVLEGEALKQVQIACGYFDLKAGKYAGGSSGAEPWGPGFPPGGFAGYSSLNLPPGEYELRCFVGETLVAVFPLTVR